MTDHPLVVARVEADATGRIVAWDRGAAALFGHPVDDPPRHIDELVPTASLPMHEVAFEEATEQGASVFGGRPVALVARHADGAPMPVTMQLHRGGSVPGAAWTALLTERASPAGGGDGSGAAVPEVAASD